MDEASGWCEGCLRTLDEIATWGGLDEAGKRAVLLSVSARRPRWRELRRLARSLTVGSSDDVANESTRPPGDDTLARPST